MRLYPISVRSLRALMPGLIPLAGALSLTAGAQTPFVTSAVSSSHFPAASLHPRLSRLPVSAHKKLQAASHYGSMPLYFERNVGQAKTSTLFQARGSAYNVALTNGAAEIILPGHNGKKTHTASRVLRMKPAGMNSNPVVVGEEALPGKVNYIIGNDPKKWHSDVPTYGKVRLKQVYSGIDLVYYGNQKQLEYDFIVQPGANAKQVALDFSGAQGVRLASNGDLLLRADGQELRWKQPVAYQTINGKRQMVEAHYALNTPASGTAHVRMNVGDYDHTRPLVIDPTLTIIYRQYLTGTGGALGNGYDRGLGIAVDNVGNTYVVGYTESTNLSQPNSGGRTAFINKLTPGGSSVYFTLLGGTGSSKQDEGRGVAIDSSGNAYITGITQSADFPKNSGITNNVPNGTTLEGNQDAFLLKLNANGNTVIYSTFLGGGSNDTSNSVAIDNAGTAYITGSAGTNANNIPFPTTANAYQTTFGGTIDAYLAKFTFNGTTLALAYSSYFGGTGVDRGAGVDVEPTSGIAYVAGTTVAPNFPHTASGYQTTHGDITDGAQDGFLIKVDTTKSGSASLLYGTFFGGSKSDGFTSIVLKGSGIVDIAGYTQSANFPTHNAYATAIGNVVDSSNLSDATFVELDTTQSGSAGLKYSTYLGGSENDQANSIALDSSGNAYITGYTASPTNSFPTRNAVQAASQGGPSSFDAFVTEINPSLNGNASLIYSTFFGTTRDDIGLAIAVDGVGSAYITGYLGDQNADGSPNNASFEDAFIAKIGVNQPPVANGQTVTVGESSTIGVNITLSATDPENDPLTYTVVSSPSHGTLSGTAPNLTYKPTSNYFGTDSFTFKANDTHQDSNTATITINVVGKPTANNQSVSVPHNSATAITLTGSDPNSPARNLTYTITTNPTHGTLSGTAPNVTYTPTSGYHGSDSFTFTVNNGVVTSNTATVSVTVATGTPTANAQSVTISHNTATAITLMGSDDDTPGLPLTYAISTNPTHGTLSGFNASTGSVTYTPSAGYAGSDSFKFTVSNGTNTSSAATVTLTVAAGTPTANGQSVTTNQDTAKAITLTGSDPDVPAKPLTYAIATNPTHGTLSGFSSTTGSVTYTPTASYVGSDSFTFTVNNGTNTSAPATVSITVNQVVLAPTANSQSVTTNQDTAVGITLTGSDPNSPPRSLTYTLGSNPTHGTLSGTAPNLTYTPTAGYVGSDSFTFTVSNGSKISNTATVSITVNQVVLAPTANNQSVTTNQDTAVGITLTGSDPNNPPRSLTYSIVSGPAHGTLSGTAPNLTYTPTAGYSGPDSFTFKVNNGVKDSNTATVSITVTPVTPAGPTDVSGIVTVTRGVFVYDRPSGTYSQTVTLTNTSNAAISGPISLILSNLTNGTLQNATGITSAVLPAGRPYINLPAGNLAASGAPGASTTLTLRFVKTGSGAISYATQVVAGAGSR